MVLVPVLLTERLTLTLLDVLLEGGLVLVLLSQVSLLITLTTGVVFLLVKDAPACTTYHVLNPDVTMVFWLHLQAPLCQSHLGKLARTS